jgi:EpsI family protein
MTRIQRIAICGMIVASGLAAQAVLEGACRTERPALHRPLSSLPMEIGDWVGADRPVSAQLVQESQATEYVSRTYENRQWPGLELKLWLNYSLRGANLRHTPAICLPGAGWTKVESQSRILEVPAEDGLPLKVSRLAYSQGELVQNVGFWYYIFGEGKLENYVRSLPITSQSSHGRATRGSSMTVEVFYSGDLDQNGDAFREFARELIRELNPILPTPRAAYYLP